MSKEFSPKGADVMVNFMRQPGWVTGCPYIWLNIILDVSVSMFPDEINTRINGPSKVICPWQCDGQGPIHRGPKKNKKAGEGRIWPFLPELGH